MNPNPATPSPRNLQLDFFRGLALMIIFINHTPFNPWFAYTPSRLGPSDAAETFVFLSGFAAAIAFGRTFKQAGLALGSIRILFRCSQIYLGHLISFLLMACLVVFVTSLDATKATWHIEKLQYFFDHTPEALLALVSLRYVPNFIDILPMYLIILLWLPMVWALSSIHVMLAMGFSVSLYIAAGYFGWELTADPSTGRVWYFNPFCWQLVFFTGFAFGSGWLPIPRYRLSLMLACLAYAVFCYPLENAYGYDRLPWFAHFRQQWEPLLNKNHLGILRYLHFLAMTYMVSHFMRKRPQWLKSKPAREVISMGRQSLPIFILGICLSFIGGVLLDGVHADLVDSLWVMLAGLGLMILAARFLNWLDLKPWKNLSPTSDTQDWPKQGLLACSLLILTAAPLQLLQSTPTDLSIAATSSAEPDTSIAGLSDLDKNAAPLSVEPVAFLPQDTTVEFAETL
jgi:hypothetical protein